MARRAEDWILCATKPGWEDKAARSLHQQHIEYYLPRFFDTLLKRRRVLFPSYIFARPDGSWVPLTGTRGISYVITFGEKPATVRHREVQALKARENEHGLVTVPQVTFVKGEPVLVGGGRFKDQIGLYQGQDGIARTKVLFDMMGRSVEVRIDTKLLKPTT